MHRFLPSPGPPHGPSGPTPSLRGLTLTVPVASFATRTRTPSSQPTLHVATTSLMSATRICFRLTCTADQEFPSAKQAIQRPGALIWFFSPYIHVCSSLTVVDVLSRPDPQHAPCHTSAWAARVIIFTRILNCSCLFRRFLSVRHGRRCPDLMIHSLHLAIRALGLLVSSSSVFIRLRLFVLFPRLRWFLYVRLHRR